MVSVSAGWPATKSKDHLGTSQERRPLGRLHLTEALPAVAHEDGGGHDEG